MRSVRFAWLFVFPFLAVPSLGKQAPQQTSAPQPTSDPQAVAVVQAAITALGGATAIGQPQSWTFQGAMRGPITNDKVNYTITMQLLPVQQITTNRGTIKRTPMTQSFFVPVLVGKVLVDQLQDVEFSMSYRGSVTVNSKLCTEITFSVSAADKTSTPDQIWDFDNVTKLPFQVEFSLPAEVGASVSPPGIVYLDDYRPVSGVMYPFLVGIPGQGGLPEIITIQSLTPSTTAVSPAFNNAAGDISR